MVSKQIKDWHSAGFVQVGWEVEDLSSTLTTHPCSSSPCNKHCSLLQLHLGFFLKIPLISHSFPHIGQECEGEQNCGARDVPSMSKRRRWENPGENSGYYWHLLNIDTSHGEEQDCSITGLQQVACERSQTEHS